MADPLIPALLQSRSVWARRLAYATATGVFLGVVGAFGTFQAAPLPSRVAGWVIMLWVGTAIFPVIATVAVIKGRDWRMPIWLTLPVSIAIGSVPMTFAANLVTRWLIQSHGQWNWLWSYGQVVVVALPIVGAYVALRETLTRRPAPAASGREPARPDPALLARLPARLGRDLLCLEMEDHYVRAHTALGSDLMLMRMRDAVALLEGMEGIRVHRSWWVASHAVESYAAAGRRTVLKLRNGLEVPVARANVATVRQAGWLT